MKTIFTLLGILAASLCFGQTSYRGKVIDIEKQALAYANVVGYTHDSLYVAGTTTDEDGAFTIKGSTEIGYIEISFIGYEMKTIHPSTSDLGTIMLTEGQALNEITITGKRPTIVQKVDRLVFDIANTVAGSGGDALDVLRVTPGVVVDNDNLSIIGKGNVRVMVNGRMIQLADEQLMDYLSSISSDDIKKIEVITAPPSKYDAEGNSGLINILLKKAKADSWNNQVRGSFIYGSYPLVTLGNTYSFDQGKWTVQASLNGKKGHRGSINTLNIEYPKATWQNTFRMKDKHDLLSGRLGVDYKLTEKSSVGIAYEGSYNDADVTDEGRADIRDGQGSYLINGGFVDGSNTHHALNTHYVHSFNDEGKMISVDLDFFEVENPFNREFSSQRFVTNPYIFKANNISNQKIQNYSAKVDMEYPMEWVKLSYGAKVSHTITDSDVKFFNLSSGFPVLDPQQSNVFQYKEGVQAVYGDAAKSLGKYWQAKLGLRLEHTSINGASKTLDQVNKDTYLKLFPTMYLAYTPDQNNQFSLNYNRRIDRPYFQNLNPFRFYINANSYQVGNPFLRPQIVDNVEMQHVYQGRLISKVFASYTNDGSNTVLQVNDDTKQLIATNDNFFNAYNYGLSETLVYNPMEWWSTMSQASISKQDTRQKKDKDYDILFVSGWNVQLYSKHTFTLSKKNKFKAEATFLYAGPQKMMYFTTSSVFGLDLGLRFTLFDKLDCSIAANDIFRTKVATLYTTANGIKQDIKNQYDSRYVKVGLSYRFGNQKIRVNKRSSGNNDVMNRVK